MDRTAGQTPIPAVGCLHGVCRGACPAPPCTGSTLGFERSLQLATAPLRELHLREGTCTHPRTGQPLVFSCPTTLPPYSLHPPLPSPVLPRLHRPGLSCADAAHASEQAAALSKCSSALRQGCGWEQADISLFHPLLPCSPPPPSPLPSSPHSHTDTHRGPSLGDAPVPVRLRLPILCFLCLSGQGVKLLQYRPARSSRSH